MQYSIEVMKVGQSQVPGPEVYWMSHWNTLETLYFYVVLVRAADVNILVNTGPPRNLSGLNKRWEKFIGPEGKMIRQENEEIEKALELRNLKPNDINLVLISPLQAYATANIPLFKNAEICISKRGWDEDYHKPVFPLHVESEWRIPPDVMQYLAANNERLRLVDDGEVIIPGITAKWVGTHHRSSMAYSINTEKGNVVVSDCFFKYENLEKMHPLGINESMQECFDAYAWINKTADIVIPLYDPEVMTRYPDGKIC